MKKLAAGGWTKDVMDAKRGVDENGVARDDFDAGVKAVIACFSRPHMGIIVSGEYGCGKTAFLRAIAPVERLYFLDMNARCDREIIDPELGGDYYREAFQKNVVIDDLGAELRKHYGEDDYSEARDFICEYHTRGRGRLFITTNLRMSELLERYGGRLVDRLKDIGVPVRFYGKSKRTWEIPK